MRWVILAVGLAAFALALRNTDLDRTGSLIAATGPLLLVCLLPYLVQIGFDSASWNTLLEALGRRVRWRRLFRIRLATEAVLMSMPAGGLVGESLKPYLLRRTDNVPAAQTVASIGIKKCVLVAAEAVYLGSAFVLGYSLLSAHSEQLIGTSGLPWLVLGGVVFLLLVAGLLSLAFVAGSVGDRVYRGLARIPIKSLRAWLDGERASFSATDSAFATIARSSRLRLLVSFLFMVAAWFTEAGETYLLLLVIGVDLPVLYVLTMEAVVVFTRNLAFFVPAGLGVQDAGYLAFLGAFGVDTTASAPAFVLLKRGKELVWIAAGYFLFLRLTRLETGLNHS